MSKSTLFSTDKPLAANHDVLWLACCAHADGEHTSVLEVDTNIRGTSANPRLLLKIFRGRELEVETPIAVLPRTQTSEIPCAIAETEEGSLLISFGMQQMAQLLTKSGPKPVVGFICAIHTRKHGIAAFSRVQGYQNPVPVARFCKDAGSVYVVGTSGVRPVVVTEKKVETLGAGGAFYVAFDAGDLSIEWAKTLLTGPHVCATDLAVASPSDRRLVMAGQAIGAVRAEGCPGLVSNSVFSWVLVANADGKASVLAKLGKDGGVCTARAVAVRGPRVFLSGSASGIVDFDRIIDFGPPEVGGVFLAALDISDGALVPAWSAHLASCTDPIFAQSPEEDDELVLGAYFWLNASLVTQNGEMNVSGSGALNALLQTLDADGTPLAQRVVNGVSLQRNDVVCTQASRVVFCTTIKPFTHRLGSLTTFE